MNVNLALSIFPPLPTVAGGFACVVADVASRFKSNSIARPGRNAMRHYRCHPMQAFAALPVRQVVADNAYLWFWTTGPLIVIGAHIPVIKAWGFKPTAMGFIWVKLNKRASFPIFDERAFAFGGGFTTCANAEYCLLCRRGLLRGSPRTCASSSSARGANTAGSPINPTVALNVLRWAPARLVLSPAPRRLGRLGRRDRPFPTAGGPQRANAAGTRTLIKVNKGRKADE